MDVNVKQSTWSISITENEVLKTMPGYRSILKMLVNLTTVLSECKCACGCLLVIPGQRFDTQAQFKKPKQLCHYPVSTILLSFYHEIGEGLGIKEFKIKTHC